MDLGYFVFLYDWHCVFFDDLMGGISCRPHLCYVIVMDALYVTTNFLSVIGTKAVGSQLSVVDQVDYHCVVINTCRITLFKSLLLSLPDTTKLRCSVKLPVKLEKRNFVLPLNPNF